MTSPANALVLLSVDDAGIARLCFNRPESLNAISVALSQALLDAVHRLLVEKTRVVVISGAGRAFMAGGDLQAFRADPEHADRVAVAMIEPMHAALRLLAEGDAPVIASLHGSVAGAGMSLALGADLVIAADDTRLTIAYGKLGTSPDGGGSWHLARLVGARRAAEIALLGDTLDAATAASLGLVNRVVPRDQLETQTLAWATRLAAGPTRAFGETRRLLRNASANTLHAHLDDERDAFARCARSDDFREGVDAFFDRRAACFRGC